MQQTKDQLTEQLNDALKQRDKIDRFLSRFLEQFEMKMDYEDTSSAHWKLYKDKTQERLELSNRIRSLEFKVKVAKNYARV